MFSITQQSSNGFNLLLLQDEDLDTSVAIQVSMGAIIHSFNVPLQGKPFNIVSGYKNGHELTNELTEKGFRGCKLAPFAGRLYLAQYRWNGTVQHCGKFMLGRHALHGFLYDAPFRETAREIQKHSAMVTLTHEYRGDNSGYPSHFDCSVMFKLREGRSLEITTLFRNRGQEVIPVQDGWHPYFNLGAPVNQLELRMKTLQHIETDDELIPTGVNAPYNAFENGKLIGDMHLDDCFLLNTREAQPLITLSNPANGLRLEMQPGDSYPYVQVYTPSDRESIAIENMSGVPDCFNNGMGLKMLEPGEEVVFSTLWTLHVSQL